VAPVMTGIVYLISDVSAFILYRKYIWCIVFIVFIVYIVFMVRYNKVFDIFKVNAACVGRLSMETNPARSSYRVGSV